MKRVKLTIEGGLPAPDRKKIAAALSEEFETDTPLILELCILSEGEIRALNARERGVDAVTDVLSFPASDYVRRRTRRLHRARHGKARGRMGAEGGEALSRLGRRL